MKPEELSAMDRGAFVEAVGPVFEHSPWVAERAWDSRPFATLDELHRRMTDVVSAADRLEQLALLRAHPDLGTRAKVSPSSESEQAGVGLDTLSQAEYLGLLQRNTAYKAKFGFPFLYAVKGSTKLDILRALEDRLNRPPDEEFATALRQVYRIARSRLEEIIE